MKAFFCICKERKVQQKPDMALAHQAVLDLQLQLCPLCLIPEAISADPTKTFSVLSWGAWNDPSVTPEEKIIRVWLKAVNISGRIKEFFLNCFVVYGNRVWCSLTEFKNEQINQQ